ncbi:MAG: diguanylate cyclase [Armatimonadetes bacterium]|nr:diguanylate cyclase [Armatimonadota bacterium]
MRSGLSHPESRPVEGAFKGTKSVWIVDFALRHAYFWVAVMAALYLCVVWTPGATPAQIKPFLDLIYYSAPALALVVYALNARSNSDRPRYSQRWWACTLMLAGICATIGADALGNVKGLFGPLADTIGGFKDALYIGSCLLLAAGALRIPRHNVSSQVRARVLMDGLMVASTVATFAWYFLIGPVFVDGMQHGKLDVPGMCYPMLDLVFACGIIKLWMEGANESDDVKVHLLFAGLLCMILGDAIYTLQGTIGLFKNLGHALDISWQMAYCFLILGAISVWNGPEKSVRAWFKPAGFLHVVLPNLSVPVIFALLASGIWGNADKRLLLGVVIGAILSLLLLVFRQIAALSESASLVGELCTANDKLQNQATQIEAQNSKLRSLNEDLDLAFRDLEDANRQLNELATTDGLTGLANKRTFHEKLLTEISRTERNGLPLCVLMIDVDHFKAYNDSFGHPAGDRVLNSVARVLKDKLRLADFLARYGGEEFVVILPETDIESAAAVAERMRTAVQDMTVDHRSVTASFGCAAYCDDLKGAMELIERADLALYTAKRQGRNAVVRYQSGMTAGQNPEPIEITARAVRPKATGAANRAVDLAVALDTNGAWGSGVRGTMDALLGAIELDACEDIGHMERVAWISLRIALEMHKQKTGDLTVRLARQLILGGLLHDVGNLGISDSVLSKDGELDGFEMVIVRRHAVLGAKLVEKFTELHEALPVVRHHHERWDGKGYPDKLAGNEIPVSARICAVADAFDAMVNGRPHKPAKTIAEALEEIQSLAGMQFDPDVVSSMGGIETEEWVRITQGSVVSLFEEIRSIATVKKSA